MRGRSAPRRARGAAVQPDLPHGVDSRPDAWRTSTDACRDPYTALDDPSLLWTRMVNDGNPLVAEAYMYADGYWLTCTIRY